MIKIAQLNPEKTDQEKETKQRRQIKYNYLSNKFNSNISMTIHVNNPNT